MKNSGKIRTMALMLSAVICLYGCGASKTSETTNAGSPAAASAQTEATAQADNTAAQAETDKGEEDSVFSSRDLSAEPDLSKAVKISLDGASASADSASVSISRSTIIITGEGIYVLSGKLNDGRVVVDAGEEAKVQLVLDGASVMCADVAAIYVATADKVFITTAEGTSNTLSNGGLFQDLDGKKTNAVIWSKADLTLNGKGKLTVSSPAGHGIVCRDDMKITCGEYDITAGKTAIRANDELDIAGGVFTLNAGKDGLHAEKDKDKTKGSIYIAGGTFTIDAGDDGIHATTTLQIDNGDISITAVEGIGATRITVNGGNVSIASSGIGVNDAPRSDIGKPSVQINGGSVVANGQQVMSTNP